MVRYYFLSSYFKIDGALTTPFFSRNVKNEIIGSDSIVIIIYILMLILRRIGIVRAKEL